MLTQTQNINGLVLQGLCFMVNFNGNIVSHQECISAHNSGFLWGDVVHEDVVLCNNQLINWEEHYLRLMASMRIFRMEIPMNFTMEFLEEEIFKTPKQDENAVSKSIMKISVYRGHSIADNKDVGYLIQEFSIVEENKHDIKRPYTADLFKDHVVTSGLLSSIPNYNSRIEKLAKIYARENDLDNCLLINEKKEIIGGIGANVFLVKDKTIITPPKLSGCVHGILRKKLIEFLNNANEYELEERAINPFEIQKVDEMFLLHDIQGVMGIDQYRKKKYTKATVAIMAQIIADFR
jgi:branched-chain amino acid aminotransferase